MLEGTAWNKKEAARLLDISRGTLYRKIVEYGLEPEARASRSRATSRQTRRPGSVFVFTLFRYGTCSVAGASISKRNSNLRRSTTKTVCKFLHTPS